MSGLQIKVGASLDTRARDVFRPVIESAKKAKAEIDRVFKSDAARALSAFESNVKRAMRSMDKELKGVDQGLTRALSGDKLERYAQAAERVFARVRESSKGLYDGIGSPPRLGPGGGGGGRQPGAGNSNDWNAYAKRTGYHSMRYFDNSLRTGAHMARRMADAAGFETNLGALVGNISTRDARLTQLSNASWTSQSSDQEKAAANRTGILDQVKGVADSTGFGRGDLIEGLQGFVGLTGDLKTGRDLLADMAKLSKATGSNMEDMMDAAAQASNALGDTKEKGAIVSQVMKVIAGQGQIGSVEIKNMATQMTRIAAMAPNFHLTDSTSRVLSSAGVNNATGQNIAVMGAMTQAARSHGRVSATAASQSAMAFIRDMSGRTQINRLQEAGLNPFADKGRTTLKDPKQIMMEMLAYTKGDQSKMSRLMPNQNSRAAVNAFAPAFNAGFAQAPGEHLTEQERLKRGLQAVSDEFDKYLKVTMDAEEIQTKFKAAMNDTASKSQVFKNKLEDVAEKLSGKLIPALERAEPKIVEFVDAFGRAVAWALENPGKAIQMALVASIARAGIEQGIRGAIESILKGGRTSAGGAVAGGFLGDFGGGTAGKIAANAGGALMIATASIATVQVGMMLIDGWFDKKRENENKKIIDDVNATGVGVRAERAAMGGKATPADLAAMAGRRSTLEKEKYATEMSLRYASAENAPAEEKAKKKDLERHLAKLVDALQDNTRATNSASLSQKAAPGEAGTGLIFQPPRTDFVHSGGGT